MSKARDLGNLADAGSAALYDVGTGPNDVVQLDGTSKLPAVDGSQLTGLSSGVTTLGGLTDVDNTTPLDKHVIIYDGVTDNRYENRLLTEADISDLQAYATSAHVHDTADITTGTFDNARIAASSVTQHAGALDHNTLLNYVAAEHLDWSTDQGATNLHVNNITAAGVTQHQAALSITESQVSDLQSYLLNTTDTLTGNLTITGDLTVSGTTTTVNSNEVNIADAIIKLNSDHDVNTPASSNAGIEVQRGTGTPAESNVFLLWQESTDEWGVKIGTGAFNAFSLISHVHDTADITTGTFADARIAATNVTQHQAALSITESQISDFGTYATSGHVHDTADITTGTFADARIAASSVTQHAGALDHDALLNFVANEHLDWSADLGATNLHVNNITAAGVTQHQAALSITESQISDLQSYSLASHTHTLADVTDSGTAAALNVGTAANEIVQLDGTAKLPAVDGSQLTNLPAGVTTLDGLTDVANATPADKHVLVYDGVTDNRYENRLLTEADISDFGTYATSGHVHDTADITTGTFADARIAATNVTQHQAALSITESQVSDLQAYSLTSHNHTLDSLSNVTVTTNTVGEILKWDGAAWINNTLAEAGAAATAHVHDTADITTGTFADARIAASSVTQHAGALDHDALLNFVANEHIDWTADQGATNIAFANLDVGTGATQVAQGDHNHDAAYLAAGGKAADSETLDGIDSGSFLRSDVADTKTAGNLIFNDSVKIELGTTAGNRTELEHYGTFGFITNVSNSGLFYMITQNAGGTNVTNYFGSSGQVTLAVEGTSRINLTDTQIDLQASGTGGHTRATHQLQIQSETSTTASALIINPDYSIPGALDPFILINGLTTDNGFKLRYQDSNDAFIIEDEDALAYLTIVRDGDITITPKATGDLILDGVKWPQADGTNKQLLQTNGAAQSSWVSIDSTYVSDFNTAADTRIAAANVSDLNDTTITTIAAGEVLKWDGAAWINNTLAEAGAAATAHVHDTADITTGTFADARIAASNVTQHQAALSITESQISDFGSYLPLTGGTLTGTLTLDANPAGNLEAATKQYVDNVAQGLSVKGSVHTSTTANITLSGEQTLDGVLTSASRVLVKNQTAPAENGIYVSAAGAWTRATDTDAWDELVSAFVFVEEGTANADTGWVCSSNAGGTLGTTAVDWIQFSGAGSYTADGQGIELSGSQFSIELDGTKLSKSASGLTVNDANLTITESQVSDLKSYLLDTTDTFTGTLTINDGTNNVVESYAEGIYFGTGVSGPNMGQLSHNGSQEIILKNYVHGRGVSISSENISGTNKLIANFDPDAMAAFYNTTGVKIVTISSNIKGIEFGDSVNNGNTKGVLGHDDTLGITLRNNITSGKITISAKDAGGSVTNEMIVAHPDTGVEIFADDILRLDVTTTGATVVGTLEADTIVSAAVNGDLTITPNGTGNLVLDGVNWPQADGTNKQLLQTNGAAQSSWASIDSTYISDFNTAADTRIAAANVDDLNDVTNTTPADKHVLVYDGVTDNRYENRLLVESDISDLQAYLLDTTDTFTGVLTVTGSAAIDNITIDGNTISSTDTNGSVTITPNGTGDIVLDGQKWPQADGAANQVLATDGAGQTSWTDNGSMVFLGAADVSGVSQVLFEDLMTSTYDHYVLYINDLTVNTDVTGVYVQMSLDNGTTYKSGASDYGWGYTSELFTGSDTKTQSTASDHIGVIEDTTGGHELGTGTGEGLWSGVVDISTDGNNPANMFWKCIGKDEAAAMVTWRGAGAMTGFTGRVTAFRIYPSSGLIAGTMQLYGVLK